MPRLRHFAAWMVKSLSRQGGSQCIPLDADLDDKLQQTELRREAAERARALRDAIARDLRQMQDETREKYGTFSDSALLIREDRDKRG
jgi:hypothetical protein